MKVAVFENEFNLIKSIFDVANSYYFNNKFEFDYFTASQNLFPFDNIKKYKISIVDIDLSQKSELDGYALISKLNQIEMPPKIIIMTGHSRVENTLKERSLPLFPIIKKPLDIEDFRQIMENVSRGVKEEANSPDGVNRASGSA